MLVISHPADIKVDFASIDSIQGLCKSKLYPVTGRLVNGNSNMVCKKFKDTGKVMGTRCGYEYDYEAWCIYQDESQERGEVKRYGDALE
jgi:hypothetical protein